MSERVTIERTYPHPPTAVFDAWTDVEILGRWFGCGVDTLWQIHEWDPVPGGAIAVSMEIEGQRVEMTGRFDEVDRPTRLRYRWGADQTVTAEFRATTDGCHLTVTHEGAIGDGMAPVLTGGWSASVQQLDDELHSRLGHRVGRRRDAKPS